MPSAANDPARVIESKPVPIRQRLASVPRRVADVIDAALRERPRIGFQTSAEFRLAQLSCDHPIVQLLLDHQEITADEVPAHPARGQLTRFVGMPGEAFPETTVVSLQNIVRLVLCTDGLVTMLRDDPIARHLQLGTPETSCQQLIAAANKQGGADNVTVVTVVVIDVVEQ